MAVLVAIAARMFSTALWTIARFRRSWLTRGLTGCAAALAITAVTALIAASDEADVNKDAYVAANQRVLAALPVFPGAHTIATVVVPYYEAGGGRSPVGFTTLRRYRLPRGATVDGVAAFYRSRLRSRWRLTEQIAGDEQTGPVLNFARDTASASVNLESKEQRVLEVSVDARSHVYSRTQGSRDPSRVPM